MARLHISVLSCYPTVTVRGKVNVTVCAFFGFSQLGGLGSQVGQGQVTITMTFLVGVGAPKIFASGRFRRSYATVDEDNMRMKFSAFNIRFNSASFDPLGSRSPPYERIKFGYPPENVRFLLLSTNLAREWLQIDTDLLRIITSTAEEFSGGTNIDDLERF